MDSWAEMFDRSLDFLHLGYGLSKDGEILFILFPDRPPTPQDPTDRHPPKYDRSPYNAIVITQHSIATRYNAIAKPFSRKL